MKRSLHKRVYKGSELDERKVGFFCLYEIDEDEKKSDGDDIEARIDDVLIADRNDQCEKEEAEEDKVVVDEELIEKLVAERVEQILADEKKRLEEEVSRRAEEIYEEEKRKGYNEGFEKGKAEGYKAGYDKGFLEGKREGFDGGYKEGFEKGKAEARDVVFKRWDALFERVESSISEFERVKASLDEAIKSKKSEIIDVCISAIEKILIEHPKEEIVISVLEEGLSRLPDREKVIVKLNPKDIEVLKNRGIMLDVERIIFKEDPTLKRGSCIIESEIGIVESRIEDRIKEVLSIFGEDA